MSSSLDRLDSHLTSIYKAPPAGIKPIVTAAKADVSTMRGQLADAQIQTDKVAGQRDWWQSHSQEQDAVIQKSVAATKRYQRKLDILGWAIAGLAGLLAYSVLGGLTARIAMTAPQVLPYVFAIRVASGGLVFLTVFSAIRYW
jgi:hypothetical protein